MNQQWIRASERMPKSQEHVLVATEGKGFPRVFEGVWLAKHDMEYCGDDEGLVCDIDDDDVHWFPEGWYGVSFYDGWPCSYYTLLESPEFVVTHWMPIPTHPRRKQEQEQDDQTHALLQMIDHPCQPRGVVKSYVDEVSGHCPVQDESADLDHNAHALLQMSIDHLRQPRGVK